MRSKLIAFVFVAAAAAGPVGDPADRVRAKLQQLQNGKAAAGSTVIFTSSELNSYARSELPVAIPQGVRQPRLELAEAAATGYALIDFLRIQRSQGSNVPWLLARLIEGERSVKVVTRIVSGSGQATVYLERVEIGGIAVSGGALDFIIHEFFLPLYPDAKINQPFALGENIDRIEVHATAAKVIMRR